MIQRLFLLKMKQSKPVTKGYRRLKDQSVEKREGICKKFHSFVDIQPVRFACSRLKHAPKLNLCTLEEDVYVMQFIASLFSILTIVALLNTLFSD